MGIVVAVSYLYPRAVSFGSYVVGVVRFANEREHYETQLEMLINYIEVDKGLSKAQMEPGDTIPRFVLVHVDGKEVERKVDIRLQSSGDYKIFVNDGNVGVYGTYFNHSLQEWEYYDFKKHHHVTYQKD
jgi:sporulation-control protein spo0M